MLIIIKETEDLLLEERVQYMQFKYATLDTATESFSETNRLGCGGFGEVFKVPETHTHTCSLNFILSSFKSIP
jgi:hypothetical protein